MTDRGALLRITDNGRELASRLHHWDGRDGDRPTAGQVQAAQDATAAIDAMVADLHRVREGIGREMARVTERADARLAGWRETPR